MDINRNNYEIVFTCFVDGELSPAEMRNVETFLVENEDLRKEFEWFRQTVLVPSEIKFQPRELLFRREEKKRVIPFYGLRIAAAGLLIITGSWFLIHVKRVISSQERSKENMTLAKTDNPSVPVKRSTIKVQHFADAHQPSTARAQQPAISRQALNPDVQKQTFNHQPSTADAQQSTFNHQPVNAKVQQSTISDPSLAMVKPSAVHQPSTVNVQRLPENRKTESPDIDNALTNAVVPFNPLAVNPPPGAESATKGVESGHQGMNTRPEDAQADHAISIVALDDRNRAISGFFKKLTQRSLVNEKDRKVSVSVFQFSY